MTPHQISLFPTRDSLQQVEQEAIASLPITEPNQLIALLQIQANTLAALAALTDKEAPHA
jgi:hypothetical protein